MAALGDLFPKSSVWKWGWKRKFPVREPGSCYLGQATEADTVCDVTLTFDTTSRNCHFALAVLLLNIRNSSAVRAGARQGLVPRGAGVEPAFRMPSQLGSQLQVIETKAGLREAAAGHGRPQGRGVAWIGPWASHGAQVVKNLPARAGDIRDAASIPGSGRSPGGGHGNPLQCSCLENPTDRGAWRATTLGIAKSQAWLRIVSWNRKKTLGEN